MKGTPNTAPNGANKRRALSDSTMSTRLALLRLQPKTSVSAKDLFGRMISGPFTVLSALAVLGPAFRPGCRVFELRGLLEPRLTGLLAALITRRLNLGQKMAKAKSREGPSNGPQAEVLGSPVNPASMPGLIPLSREAR
jgi:chorismate mutase